MSSQQPDSPEPTNESPKKSDADKRKPGSNSQPESYGCTIALLIIIILVVNVFHIGRVADYITAFRSYFWESTQGTIVSSRVAVDNDTLVGAGPVVFQVELDGKPLEITKFVRKDWYGDSDGLRKAMIWASAYTPGNQITVYYNKSGWTSLERGPGGTGIYIHWYGLMITVYALLYIIFLCFKMKRSQRLSINVS